MPSSPQGLASALAKAAEAHTKTPSSTNKHLPNPTRSSAMVPEPEKEYVSKIGILASSMPYYHNQYMEQQKANIAAAAIARPGAEELDPDDAEHFSKLSLVPNPKEQSSEDQAATARRLKPHSRSTVQLQSITANAAEMPENMTQVPAKKPKSTKWQFGIRSRNLPFDAMHCIYKALAAHNAQWEMTTPPATPPDHGPAGYPVNVKGATHTDDTLSHSSGSPEAERSGHTRDLGHPVDEYMPNFSFDGNDTDDGSTLRREDSDDDIDPNVIPEGYVPKDPWCIRVRWRKDGMYPPGTTHSSSAHSSRIDLTNEEQARRRGSTIGSLSSATGSTTSVGGQQTVADSACYVYMDVQLYTLEQDTYLVDFKCAGYETMVEVTGAVGEAEKRLAGSGFRVVDKDVTSPQPFLDLTNKLVIHLARG